VRRRVGRNTSAAARYPNRDEPDLIDDFYGLLGVSKDASGASHCFTLILQIHGHCGWHLLANFPTFAHDTFKLV
jgi:hypothetical protein